MCVGRADLGVDRRIVGRASARSDAAAVMIEQGITTAYYLTHPLTINTRAGGWASPAQ
jgi:hypothetical protein